MIFLVIAIVRNGTMTFDSPYDEVGFAGFQVLFNSGFEFGRTKKILRRHWRRKQGKAIGLCCGLIVIGKVKTLHLKL